jgi:hypothetical protein
LLPIDVYRKVKKLLKTFELSSWVIPQVPNLIDLAERQLDIAKDVIQWRHLLVAEVRLQAASRLLPAALIINEVADILYINQVVILFTIVALMYVDLVKDSILLLIDELTVKLFAILKHVVYSQGILVLGVYLDDF